MGDLKTIKHGGIFNFRGLEVSGTLSLSNDGRGELTLIPPNDIDSRRLFDLSQDDPNRFHIHGLLSSGGLVTLPDAILTSSRVGLTSYGTSEYLFICNTVLFGDVAHKTSDIQFDACRYRMTCVEFWLGRQSVEHSYTRKGMRLDVFESDPIKLEVDDGFGEKILILFDKQNYIKIDDYNIKIEEEEFIWIIPLKCKSREWFDEMHHKIWQLFSIICGESIKTIEQKFYKINSGRPRSLIGKWKKLSNQMSGAYEVKRHMPDYSYPAEFDHQLMLTKISDFKNIPNLFESWLKIYPELRYTAGLTISNLRKDDNYIESKIAINAQALEAIHRYRYPDRTTIASKKEFKEIRQWVFDNLPQEYMESREFINNRLPNINMYSIKNRMADIFCDARGILEKITIEISPEELAQKFGDMRNNTAHGTSSGGETMSMVMMQRITYLIAEYHFLILLGMSDELASQICTKYYLRRFKVAKFS